MSETTPATMTATTQSAVVKRHPIRGVLWGLMMGIGLSLVLVIAKVISLDLTTMIVVTAIAILFGLLWSTLGPAKAPKGPPPATVTVAPAPEPSRFDDFTDPVGGDASDDDEDAQSGESSARNDGSGD